jgi:hypothetical protein
LLAATTDVLPSILAYTQEEWRPEGKADQHSVQRLSVTPCAFYEPEYDIGRVESCSRSATRGRNVI